MTTIVNPRKAKNDDTPKKVGPRPENALLVTPKDNNCTAVTPRHQVLAVDHETTTPTRTRTARIIETVDEDPRCLVVLLALAVSV